MTLNLTFQGQSMGNLMVPWDFPYVVFTLMFNSNRGHNPYISQRSRVRPLVKHQQDTIYGESSDTVTFYLDWHWKVKVKATEIFSSRRPAHCTYACSSLILIKVSYKVICWRAGISAVPGVFLVIFWYVCKPTADDFKPAAFVAT